MIRETQGTTMTVVELQPRIALRQANKVRIGMSEVRLELAAGAIALAEALEDPRAGSHYVYGLLTSIRQVGPHTAKRVMFRAGVPDLKRVRDLTERQRGALLAELARMACNA